MSYDGTDVCAALVSWWNDTPAVQALTASGKLWFKEDPEEDNTLPYANYFLVSDVAEIQTTGYAQHGCGGTGDVDHISPGSAKSSAHDQR